MVNLQKMNEALRGTVFAGKIHHFSTIDSTQNVALKDAQAGEASGQVYLADEQTAGRGRGGHSWHSEPEDGLYLSVMVRPSVAPARTLLISLAAGLSAQAAIRDIAGLNIDLRWPNDLVTAGPESKKLGGILTETAITPEGTLRHAAIGIGINLNQTAMPEQLAGLSTSIRMMTGSTVRRDELAVKLLRSLEENLAGLEHPEALLDRFTAASSWVKGKQVRVAEGDGYTGVTVGLTPAGLLQVRCDDGDVRTVRHGGVRER